jgi:alpha-L-fucosidase
MYEPTWESVNTHPLPDWYDDAKLGIFLHWGIYSVPGWAPQVANIQEMLRQQGPAGMLRDNPYAEWYLNTMKIKGSPTREHHLQTYGPDFAYDDFIPEFDSGTAGADLDALAALCKDAGAKYAVLTTKHHEGFTLWPASEPHPNKGAYHAQRDLVGDLTKAVRDQGMRMGLYYSGGYDWPYNNAVLSNLGEIAVAVPGSPAYREYATNHVLELIDRYEPSVLWNDICWPAGGNLAEFFAYYYNRVPDGVINDRWLQPTTPRSAIADAAAHGVGTIVQALWRFIPESQKGLTFPGAKHFDFNTPEYETFDEVVSKKWEATRGIGHSFGANRNERPEDIVTTTELVRSFCDIVAKNGNLLIGIGPDANGNIAAEQQRPIRGLGAWLRVNGEAIFGTRPWLIAQTTTTEGTEVRFTRKGDEVFALLIDLPGSREFGLRGIDATEVTQVRLLGSDGPLQWRIDDGQLRVTMPERIPVAAAYALSLGSGARPA